MKTLQIHQALLETVTYADIFDYPLTVPEIHRYLPAIQLDQDSLAALLPQLAFLRESNGYYTLPGREFIIETRKRRSLEAARLWQAARFYGRWIASLPCVRMVAVTGSLAVNNVERGADIDYLIVTTPGRLWTCRLLTLAIARFASLRGISLCPNYLVSENALALSSHSLYAAHELLQMVPLSGLGVYWQMRDLNPWALEYLPNAVGTPLFYQTAWDIPPSSLEWLFKTPLGNWFENWEMRRKIRKLEAENVGNPESVFNPDQCKGHSLRHGHRTTHSLQERLARSAMETHL